MDRVPLQLSRLRDIGWSEWDPIGLLAEGKVWDHQPFADEYDRYLTTAAAGLRREWTVEEAAAYLHDIAENHMGLTSPSKARALATAKAIREYVRSIDD